MKIFLGIITVIGSIIGIVGLILIGSLGISAVQQCVYVGIFIGMGVLPYCLLRAGMEMDNNSIKLLKEQNELLKKLTITKIDQPTNSNDHLTKLLTEAQENMINKNYDEALRLYLEICTITPKAPNSNFSIACINSMKSNIPECYNYIDKAVQEGFSDFAKIKTSDLLVNFRSDQGYMTFALNGYRLNH